MLCHTHINHLSAQTGPSTVAADAFSEYILEFANEQFAICPNNTPDQFKQKITMSRMFKVLQ